MPKPRIPLPPRNADGSYRFTAGMAIDADGANGQSSEPVYAPSTYKGKPLDYLANAGGPGDWYGVVTDTGEADGEPVMQGPHDPAPGAYVSATSYEHPGYDRTDPRRYVDANAVPYIVIPSHWRQEARGVVLGCRATVENTVTGEVIEAGVLDLGPKHKCGEASIATARLFGVPASPKNGGTDQKIFRYTFYPGTPAEIDGEQYELQPA